MYSDEAPVRNRTGGTDLGRRTLLSTIVGSSLLGATARSDRVAAQTEGADGYTDAWQRPLGGAPTQPVTHDGAVYVGDTEGNVFGYDVRSGADRFQASVDGAIPKYGLAVTGSAVAVATESGELLILDPDDGSVERRILLGGSPAGLTTLDRFVFVFDDSGSLTKYDLDAGETTWTRTVTDQKVRKPQTVLATENRMTLLVKNRVLLVSPTEGEVVDRVTSDSMWAGPFRGWTGTFSNDGRTAYIVETFRSNALHIVDLESGVGQRIEYEGSGTSTCGPAAGMFFLGGGDSVQAFDEATGTEQWRVEFTTSGLSIDVFGERLVMAGSTGDRALIRAIDVTSRAIDWSVDLTEIEAFLASGASNYTFTKPVRTGEYYSVTGSAEGDNWIAAFGPSSSVAETTNDGGSGAPSGQTVSREQEEPMGGDPATDSNAGGGTGNGGGGGGSSSVLLTGVGVLVTAVLSIYVVLKRNQQG
jgi:hypothetical protein